MEDGLGEDKEVDGESDEGDAGEECRSCPVGSVLARRDGECVDVRDGCGRWGVEVNASHVWKTRGECAAVGHREVARGWYYIL